MNIHTRQELTPIVKSLNLETVEDRRSKSKVVIIHKALNSNLEIEPNKNLLQPSDKSYIL